MRAITGGGRGEGMTPVIMACMSRSWKVEVCEKKTPLIEEMINQQISSKKHVKSTKQHTLIFVSCEPTRRLALGRQSITATESGTTATTKHAILQRVISAKKNTERVRCDTGRMNANFTTTFSWRSLTAIRETNISALFFMSKMYGTPSLHAIKYVVDKKHIVCGRTRTYLVRSILLAREYTPCRSVRTCIIPPAGPRGRSHSQCCCVEFWGAVIVTTTTSCSF